MGILDIIRRKQESGTRKYYAAVPDDHVLEDNNTSAVIAENKAYFEISLSEMFLKSKTNYISGYIPMTLAVNGFKYDDQWYDIPVIVGNQLLSSIERYVKGQHIEFRNTPIVGPVPFTGSNVSLFVGLYRIEVDNLAKKLFSMMDKIISAFDLSQLSGYLGIVEKVGDGLAELIGLDKIEMRLGAMDTFGGGSRSRNPFRDGYRLYVNCPEDQVAVDKIWVRDGRLLEGSQAATATPFSRHDYCLVNIKQMENRPDLTTLPFHKLYRDSRAKIWEGNRPEAERLFLSLMRGLSQSPDLSSGDRTSLMKTYLVNYQQEKENYSAMTGILDGAGSSKAAIQKKAALADGSVTASGSTTRGSGDRGITHSVGGTPKISADLTAVKSSLQQLALGLDEIPHLAKLSEPSELNSAMLSQQLKAVKANQEEIDYDPQILADVLAYTAFAG